MTLFISFLLLCFVVGIVLWNKSPVLQYVFLSVMCLYMCYAYLYMNKI